MPVMSSAPAHAQVTQTCFCEICGFHFVSACPFPISGGDCPVCEAEKWDGWIAAQYQLRFGSAVMLSDALDHSFAGMF